MTIFLASFTGAIVVFMLIYFFVVTRLVPKNKVHQRLRELKYGTKEAAEKSKDSGSLADIPFVERTIIPFFEGLEKSLLRFAPAGIHAMLEQRIMLAGKQGIWSVNAFVCGWLLSMAAGFMLMFLIIQDKDLEFIQRVVALLLGVVMGGALPFVFLNSLIRKRQFKIQRQLPELLDLLCVSVQAGLSFDGAITKIVGRMKGPLIDECERMQRDTRMGMPRKRSMQQMAKRCDVQEVYLFTTAVIQAERLGTSMATTLENQADNMRERRRQHAKAEALKAPVKILFPLIIFIFPALFVVVLGPAVMALAQAGLGGK